MNSYSAGKVSLEPPTKKAVPCPALTSLISVTGSESSSVRPDSRFRSSAFQIPPLTAPSDRWICAQQIGGDWNMAPRVPILGDLGAGQPVGTRTRAQKPNFNQRIWKDLEDEVRRLDKKKKVVETYVICGPIFYSDKAMKVIGAAPDELCGSSRPRTAVSF